MGRVRAAARRRDRRLAASLRARGRGRAGVGSRAADARRAVRGEPVLPWVVGPVRGDTPARGRRELVRTQSLTTTSRIECRRIDTASVAETTDGTGWVVLTGLRRHTPTGRTQPDRPMHARPDHPGASRTRGTSEERPLGSRPDRALLACCSPDAASAAPTADLFEIRDFEPAPFDSERAVVLRLGEHLVHRLPGHSCELCDLVLAERHTDRPTISIQLPELEYAPQNTLLHGQVQRFEQRRRETPDLGNGGTQQKLVDARALRAQFGERFAVEHHGFGWLEGGDGRRSRARRDQRELTHHVIGPEHPQDRLVAAWRRRPDRDVTFDDEVQRVARVTFMKDDLAASEPASPHESPHGAPGVVVQPAEQPLTHGAAFLQGAPP